MKRHPCLKGSPNHPQEYLTHTSHTFNFSFKFYNHLNIKHQTIKTQTLLTAEKSITPIQMLSTFN